MAKIKDLGINVIPETMRPPEIGPGGGCHTYTHAPAGHYYFPTPDVCCGPATCPATTIQTQYYGTPDVCCGPATCPATTIQTWQYYGTPDICCRDTCVPTTPNWHRHTGYGGLTRESIAQLKEQYRQRIAELDEYAKSIGPKTAEEIDAREKELKAELDELAARRKGLKSSK